MAEVVIAGNCVHSALVFQVSKPARRAHFGQSSRFKGTHAAILYVGANNCHAGDRLDLRPRGGAATELTSPNFIHHRMQVDPGLGRWLTGSLAPKTTTYTPPSKCEAVAARKAALRTSKSAAIST
jgi:hypothetical protein